MQLLDNLCHFNLSLIFYASYLLVLYKKYCPYKRPSVQNIQYQAGGVLVDYRLQQSSVIYTWLVRHWSLVTLFYLKIEVTIMKLGTRYMMIGTTHMTLSLLPRRKSFKRFEFR